jgi:hypothetical protein
MIIRTKVNDEGYMLIGNKTEGVVKIKVIAYGGNGE